MPLGLSGVVENKNAWQICSDKQAFANLKETTLPHAASEHQICRCVSSSPLEGGRYMCDLRELPGAPCVQPPFPGSSPLTSALTTQLWLPGSAALCQPARSSEFFFCHVFLSLSQLSLLAMLPVSQPVYLFSSSSFFVRAYQTIDLKEKQPAVDLLWWGVDVRLHLDLHFPVTNCSALVISPEQR